MISDASRAGEKLHAWSRIHVYFTQGLFCSENSQKKMLYSKSIYSLVELTVILWVLTCRGFLQKYLSFLDNCCVVEYRYSAEKKKTWVFQPSCLLQLWELSRIIRESNVYRLNLPLYRTSQQISRIKHIRAHKMHLFEIFWPILGIFGFFSQYLKIFKI